MTGIIFVCMITYSSSFFDPDTLFFKSDSVVGCQKIANHKSHGILGSWDKFDMSKPEDVKKFEDYCGKEGKGCE